VNGEADVREIPNSQRVVGFKVTGLQTGECVLLLSEM
jgi:hypothetical protein